MQLTWLIPDWLVKAVISQRHTERNKKPISIFSTLFFIKLVKTDTY